jgi:hypothetical protein
VEVTRPEEAGVSRRTFVRIRDAALAPAATRTHRDHLTRALE